MSVDVDVVVVGGSLAGCATAALLAQQDASVVVAEKAPRADHYKKVCTHYLQPGAVEVLERLGVREAVDAAGAVPNGTDVWTRYGWARHPAGLPEGRNLRREKLDPLVRGAAAATPGVQLRQGVRATGLLRDATGRASGVVAGGEPIRARVVVGADGRGSGVARMAEVRGRVRPNARMLYFAHFDGARLPWGTGTRAWFLDPDVVYVFPNDDGVVLIGAALPTSRAAEVKADPEAAIMPVLERLPDGPDLSAARRTTPWLGRVDLPNVRRPATAPGLAFVGDAAQASDPVWGVGCGFALTSAMWLADALGPELRPGGDVDAGLRRYRRRHARELAGHHWLMSDYATGRRFNSVEKLLYRAAPHDERVARDLLALATRTAPPHLSLTPATLARATRTVVREAVAR